MHVNKKIGDYCSNSLWILALQKLSALSASLARVVSSTEEEEAEPDSFPVEGVRKPVHTLIDSVFCFENAETKTVVS